MKKLCLILSCILLLSAVTVMASCSFLNLPPKTTKNVYLEYELIEDKNAYRVTGSNIAYKSLEDGWEMVDLVIPSEYRGRPVTEIGAWAFRNSDILRSVIIPESIEKIVAGAFFDCNHLERVTIPKSVKYILGAPFESCNSLCEMLVDPQNAYYCSVDGNLYSKDQSEFVFYAPGKTQAKFEIPQGVSSVHRDAFSHCEFLKSIAIPETVRELPYDAIMYCKGMQGITVDENNPIYCSINGNLYSKDGKTFLRLCAFAENTTLIIPEGVTSIEDYAAYYGDSLTAVTIPETVIYIAPNAFAQCPNLTEAVFEDPSGWRVIPQRGKFLSAKELSHAQLSSAATAAEYLAKKYDAWEWQKEN